MIPEYPRPAMSLGFQGAAVTDASAAVGTEAQTELESRPATARTKQVQHDPGEPVRGLLREPPSGAREETPFEQRFTLRAVTGIAGMVVGLTFLFGFGNVWTLALSLGVPPWVAPLVAPAVDLSVLGLLLAIRHMALHGARREQMRPARRLLIFSSTMTLALNVAAPLIAGHLGKAAFDAVGPLLLIGRAEVGPGLLQTISGIQQSAALDRAEGEGASSANVVPSTGPPAAASPYVDPDRAKWTPFVDDLLGRARQEDAWHRETYLRPISAETLRKRLHVGAARARILVTTVRAEEHRHPTLGPNGPGAARTM